MTQVTNDIDAPSTSAGDSDDRILKVANCSGFYGDKLSAAKAMVEGGPIDVLTGDYLAELTMTILYNQQQSRGGNAGYVGTFLKQLKEVVKPCICLLYTSPSPRDRTRSRMPSSA